MVKAQVIIDLLQEQADLINGLRAENSAQDKELSEMAQHCDDLSSENARLRAELGRLAEAGTGYSQQTMDALVHERDGLKARLSADTAMAWKAAIAARKEAHRTPEAWRELEQDDPDTWITVMRAGLDAALEAPDGKP